jgi:hypothetical protein
MLRLLVPTLLLLTVGACEAPTASPGRLHATADGTDVVLRNLTDRTVYTFVVDASRLALINWAPCSDPRSCEGIAPGTEERVSYESLAAPWGEPVEEVAIFAWHLIPRRDGSHEVRWIRSPGAVRL